jgi:hypothetical protein
MGFKNKIKIEEQTDSLGALWRSFWRGSFFFPQPGGQTYLPSQGVRSLSQDPLVFMPARPNTNPVLTLLYIIYIYMCPLFTPFACYFISYSNFNVSLVWANSHDKCFLWVSYVSNICQLLQVTFRSVSATIAIYAMTGI